MEQFDFSYKKLYRRIKNKSCTANIVMGMHANAYYYAGGLDDWFYEKDSA